MNGGHVFPGATLPFGMAKASADVNGEDQGGFASDNSNITGFSHMHDSGTGGVSLSFSLRDRPFVYASMTSDAITTLRHRMRETNMWLKTLTSYNAVAVAAVS